MWKINYLLFVLRLKVRIQKKITCERLREVCVCVCVCVCVEECRGENTWAFVGVTGKQKCCGEQSPMPFSPYMSTRPCCPLPFILSSKPMLRTSVLPHESVLDEVQVALTNFSLSTPRVCLPNTRSLMGFHTHYPYVQHLSLWTVPRCQEVHGAHQDLSLPGLVQRACGDRKISDSGHDLKICSPSQVFLFPNSLGARYE